MNEKKNLFEATLYCLNKNLQDKIKKNKRRAIHRRTQLLQQLNKTELIF